MALKMYSLKRLMLPEKTNCIGGSLFPCTHIPGKEQVRCQSILVVAAGWCVSAEPELQPVVHKTLFKNALL